MLGGIIGDIAGSVYEFNNIKTKNFPLFTDETEYTDDSILTMATADWLLHGGESGEYYYRYASKYTTPMGGYGMRFYLWASASSKGNLAKPYNSCGNGSAMRVGPVGWAFNTAKEVLAAAKASAECTHNHPEGIKGAQAVALAIFMARTGATKDDIRSAMTGCIGYDLDFDCDDIRDTYDWGATCQDTVPQAIVAFLDATDFEDSIRNAISIGGDSDTLACITGAIAEAFYGIPEKIYREAFSRLPEEFKVLVSEFENKYGRGFISEE